MSSLWYGWGFDGEEVQVEFYYVHRAMGFPAGSLCSQCVWILSAEELRLHVPSVEIMYRQKKVSPSEILKK